MASVFIATPIADDRQPFLEAVARSKTLHGLWVSPPATPAAFAEYLHRLSRDDRAGFLIGKACSPTEVFKLLLGPFPSQPAA